MRALATLLLFAGATTAAASWGDPAPATVSWGDLAPFVPPPAVRGYAEAWREAVQSGKPLAVWLGYPPPLFTPPDVLYWHTPEADWEGYSGPGVVVSVPDGGGLYFAAFIDASRCSEGAIRAAVATARVRWRQPAAAPAPVRMQAAPAMMAPVRMMFGSMRMGRGGGGC
jgi:hypothetical protein